ncbi:peptidylprolyl isomerase [Pontimicrobium sp. IMCC45349]|uniref:peptidylprolyl isomerase n=1 Tax=Pontimicrobium sp. IMCC45349 TaxID=3391574 RepID=UPI0039A0F082
MKILKHSIKFLTLAFLLSLSSCKDKYPDLGEGLFAEIVTNKGTMVAKLTYDKTPVTVANFVALAEGTHPMVTDSMKGKPFYNGLTFHRVMDQFMIQGGDPLGTGAGSPGYKFGDEFDETLKHSKPGILSMANSGPSSNGSQFFITEKETPWLDNKHSVFGELVLGLDIQDSISNVEVAPGNKPVEPIIMQQVNIIRQGFDARKFDAAKTWETELPLLEEKAQKKLEEKKRKAEEARLEAEKKTEEAAKEILPTLNEYKSKAKALPSGLKMHTITEGNGVKPKQGQTVNLKYAGYFTDGKLFGSNDKELDIKYGIYHEQKEQQGFYNPLSMAVSPDAPMVAGFKEGVANMKVGDKTYLYLPSHLGWGERGRGQIPPNADVIFIIEMLEIVK